MTISNLTRSQHLESLGSAAPVFGARRQWLGYVGETTGFGSLELSGCSPRRVTLVRPGDAEALREHHRLVRTGRLAPAWPRRPMGPGRVHVLDHEELLRTRADAHDSWLVAAQAVARLCRTDDEMAGLVADPLRHVLWAGREWLGSPGVVGALAALRQAADELATERAAHRAAVERMACRHDLDAIRLEIRTLAELRAEWDAVTAPDGRLRA
ncbi:hypothetical protein IFT73_18100 [Aeromicrobium sp. CFBP 8757]|uniref:hypothetical protein n=1 Tax=Aeromicrobium sp. CFBP 8757 TaxID=2775288 RepID=UPI00177B05EB|nr:hypothetical protein [Aeromicrobium sp. CFBP 8757]MBD8608772.1 hypothetical protein [Aeromicrobium sp. CFBP 8757]